MTNFIEPNFFDPHVLDVLHAAVDRAWSMVVAAEPTSASHVPEVKLVLAAGVVRAAKTGERDVKRLSKAACVFWATEPSEREAVEFQLTLH